MIVHPETKDISQIKEIWKTCFHDTDESVNQYFEKCFSEDECYISKVGDTVQACLQMIPCMICDNENRFKAKYMYAVCTKPEFQHKGIMSNLIKEACSFEKSKGTAAVLCIPDKESLFGFYKKFGFVDSVYCSTLKMSRADIEEKSKPCKYSVNCDTELFNKKRNELLLNNCFVGFPDKYISLADGSFYSTAYNDNFSCIYFQEDGFVEVSDSVWINEDGKNELFYFLKNETVASEYLINFCGENNTQLKGVIKYLKPINLNGKHIYLGFKME